jgi:parvulin-like peptidyl-prolyl isomerase
LRLPPPAIRSLLPSALKTALALALVLALAACQGRALVINDQVLSAHELDRRQALSRLAGAATSEESLERVITQVLLLQEASRRGIRVTDEDVERGLARLEQQTGGRAALVANLRRLGLSLQDLRRDLRERFMILALTDQLTAGITVSAQEVETYFAANREQLVQPDEVWLVYFAVQDRATAALAADALAQGALPDEIQASLNLPGPFDGDMGYVSPEQILPPAVRAALTGAEVGEVVGPIEEEGRWHVVQSRDVKPGQAPTLAEVEGNLREFLLQSKAREAVAAEIAHLRETASIHWRGR